MHMLRKEQAALFLYDGNSPGEECRESGLQIWAFTPVTLVTPSWNRFLL